MANIILMPMQTSSENPQYKIEVLYYQRRRATRNYLRPYWFCTSYKWLTNNLCSRQVRRRVHNIGSISHDLTWQLHIDEITANVSQRLHFIILLKRAGVEPHHLVKICTKGVAHEPNNNKTSSKTYRKGPCALNFVECVITTPSPLQDYQRWQTGGRRFAELCSRVCSNPITSGTISCLPPELLIMQFVMHMLTVFLAVAPNV